MTITALPTPPSRSGAPNSFATRFPTFLAALPVFRSELMGGFPVSLPIVQLGGTTGFVLTDLPVDFTSLNATVRINESATRTRTFRVRAGTASALTSLTANYPGYAMLMGVNTVSGISNLNGIQVITGSIATGIEMLLRLVRLGTSSKYAYNFMVNGRTGNRCLGAGLVILSGQMRQLALDDVNVFSAIPYASGSVEVSWS